MLKIQRKANGRVLFTLSGRIEAEDIDELRRLLELEDTNRKIALDLRDVTLVDRDGVKFLADCEVNDIELENCPAYIREWIGRESGRGGSGQKKMNARMDKLQKREQPDGSK